MQLVDASMMAVSRKREARGRPPAPKRRCLSCGSTPIAPGRRYCSGDCRQQVQWVLSLSKGLLRAFNARFAAFSFTGTHVILDVLPVWAKDISRFAGRRSPAHKPAEDLKRLILRWGREWHGLVNNRSSQSRASLSLLLKNHLKGLDPEMIKPKLQVNPRLSKSQRQCLRVLQLAREDLACELPAYKVKAAYKRMAKRYHPDVGGDTEKFKRLNEAHRQMLLWSENPQFTRRKALCDCWSYDGSTNRWSPPL